MDKKVTKALVIGALLFVLMVAMADSPHYSFGQVQYGWVNDGPFDGNTYGAGLAFGGEIFQIGTAYNRIELDFEATDLTINEWSVAGGFHGLLGETADLVGNLGYFDADDSGFFLDGGVRWMAFPMLEVNGFITHYEPNDSDSDQVLSLSAIAFVDSIGIGISYETANDADMEQWKVFLRFKFGNY